MTPLTPRGWDAPLPKFVDDDRRAIIESLRRLVPDAGDPQIDAWRSSIKDLQSESGELLARDSAAGSYGTILEYVMPMESRRPDCIFLVDGAVVVVEMKGKTEATMADVDQVAAYARDLRCYHRDCEGQPVVAILVPTRMSGIGPKEGDVIVCGPDALEEVIRSIDRARQSPTPIDRFLDEAAYRPLPTLVQAARELLRSGNVRRVSRAAAATEPTVDLIREIAVEAARSKTRRLILVTGVPGAGKTLVGLQAVHADYLDTLAVDRNGEKPTATAVFLSGNGPLVEVLQYELTKEKADGKTFVRGVKDYVKRYSRRNSPTPSEHVLVFDEAQRAWDRERVADGHDEPLENAKSEPELFIEFADRIPEWCVVIGLVGTGQEIHNGEEGGLQMWREAIAKSPRNADWLIHCPDQLVPQMRIESTSARPPLPDGRLNLTTEIRFHLSKDVHAFVAGLLGGKPTPELSSLAASLEQSGYHLRVTRNYEKSRNYLRQRYENEPDKRFGVIASSRDRHLAENCGIKNDFQSTKRVKFGPWFAEGEDDPKRRSCRLMEDVVTEFGCQGLELDAALIAWGSDLLKVAKESDAQPWSNALAAKYRSNGHAKVKDPYQLRVNAYRVLLTRGREASVVFVPPEPMFDATFEYLVASGFRPIL